MGDGDGAAQAAAEQKVYWEGFIHYLSLIAHCRSPRFSRNINSIDANFYKSHLYKPCRGCFDFFLKHQ
jgi:hypothetical protein